MGALIRFYFGLDPDSLCDKDFCNYYEQIIFVLKLNGTLKDE
jgi:hypothetical protein